MTFSVVDHATAQIDAINKRIAQMRAPIDRMQRSMQRFVDVSGLRKVADSFGWIARAVGTAFRAMSAIVPVLGAITSAATIAGMVKLVSSFSAWGRELTISADQIGISTQQLQQFEDAARLAGGTTEEMAGSLKSLKEISTQAFLGINLDALAYFNRYSINLKDVNGHLRNTADLMPEVIDKLTKITDAEERGRVAMQLLGAEGVKLVETIRVSGKSFAQYYADAGKFTELTQEQIQEMIKFEQAQGRLSVAFDHLGQRVAAVLATNFIPLFNHFSEFVQQHTPQIIGAVDKISAQFAKWLDNPDMWTSVGAGITKMINGLQFVVDHLDTVLRVAEDIAILFATKWALGIVASIAQVATALGPVSATLAAIAALAAIYTGNKLGQMGIEDQAKGMGFEQKPGSFLGIPGFGMPTFHNPTTGEDLTYEEMLKRQGRPAGRSDAQRWLFGPDQPGGQDVQKQSAPGATGSVSDALHITPVQYDALRGSIARIENARYDQMGGSSGRFAGKYQMGAAEIAETAARLGVKAPSTADFLKDPAMQEKFFENYTLDHHNWLMAHNAKYAAMSPEDQAAALAYAHNQGAVGASRWIDTGMEGRDAFGTSGAAYSTAVHNAFARLAKTPQTAAAPADVPWDVPRINGSVDVAVNFRNPPPNAAVTAKGSGSVNVAPPRVEHAQLADI